MKTLITITFIVTSIGANAQYNFESCHAFWKLTDKLRAGTMPSEQDWDHLRNTEGYKRKNISDAYWNAFVEAVTLVYTPGNEEQIAERMQDDVRLMWIQRYAQEEEQLKAYVREIEELNLIDSATQIVRAYLPEKHHNCFSQPAITYLLLDYDANGNKEGINMDLLVSYDLDNFRTGGLLAHEMFHHIVDKCEIKNLKAEVIPEHKAVMHALDLVSEEGIADLIDKSWLIFDPDSPFMLKKLLLDVYHTQSVQSIEKMNAALEALADQQSEPYSSYAHWRSITPVSGHIPAMYMGSVIRENGLEEQLIESISNPFRFYYLYHDAVKKDNEVHPEFSSKAIEFLKQLESTYIE